MQVAANSKGRSNSGSRLLVLGLTLLYFGVVLRTAWLTDDAAITFRTVLNFVYGFGPTYNIDERVQAYTHPLWFFVLTAFTLVFRNVYYVAFGVCIAISVAAVALLLVRALPNRLLILILGFSVIFSKAFIDFSTSGLENPLSHLLLFLAVALASSCFEVGQGRMTAFLLVCAGIYLNRPDTLLLVLPLFIIVVLPTRKNPRQLLLGLSIAAAPIVAWTAFSLFYYGFPFPNTAYAKLGSGLAHTTLAIQGLRYFEHTIKTDPLTLFAITTGIILGLRGSRVSKSLSAGIISYLIYVVYIGGDFMEGRFFSAPFFMSLIVVARELKNKFASVAYLAVITILSSKTMYSNILAGNVYSVPDFYKHGIADERGYYFQKYGLFNAQDATYARPEWQISRREIEVTCGGLGFSSIRSGPGFHLIDSCALTDPLLARLPAKRNPFWRIGHFYRELPTKYEDSIRQGSNLLTDATTKAYWESIRTVTRGSLFDQNRIAEIARLNLGLVEEPDPELYSW